MSWIDIEKKYKADQRMNCLLCGSNEGWTVYEKDGVISDKKVWCKVCGLIHKSLTWSPSDNDKFYNEDYLKNYFNLSFDGFDGRKMFYDAAPEVRKNNVSKIKEILKKAEKPVEIGCSSGGVLKYLFEINESIIGVDIDRESIEYAKSKGLPAKVMNLATTNEKFDFIWTSHLVEHLLDPKAFIKQIQMISTRGAHLIILVPNSLKMPEGPHAPHILNFSEKTLVQLIESSTGFRLVSLRDSRTDIFAVFKLVEKKGNDQIFSTSKREYEEHVKNLIPVIVMNIRKYYDNSLSKEELSILKSEYKKILSQGKVDFFKRLIWSSLYRIFTFKWIKTK